MTSPTNLSTVRTISVPLRDNQDQSITLRYDTSTRGIQAFDHQQRVVVFSAPISATEIDDIAQNYFAVISQKHKLYFVPKNASGDAAAAASSPSSSPRKMPPLVLTGLGNTTSLQPFTSSRSRDYSQQQVATATGEFQQQERVPTPRFTSAAATELQQQQQQLREPTPPRRNESPTRTAAQQLESITTQQQQQQQRVPTPRFTSAAATIKRSYTTSTK